MINIIIINHQCFLIPFPFYAISLFTFHPTSPRIPLPDCVEERGVLRLLIVTQRPIVHRKSITPKSDTAALLFLLRRLRGGDSGGVGGGGVVEGLAEAVAGAVEGALGGGFVKRLGGVSAN